MRNCRYGVYEIGLDKRSSLDSLQQALFAAELTGKRPVIVIIDRDGRVGPYETRIQTAARRVGVEYRSLDRSFLLRLQMARGSGDNVSGDSSGS